MKKQLFVGGSVFCAILILVATFYFLGLFEIEEKTIVGKVIYFDSFGGGFGHSKGITLQFDTGDLINLISGVDKVKMNTTGVFHFRHSFGGADEWYLMEVDYETS